ncbi:MAG: hypothetical protein QOG23_2123 [Blastocatellia bacterium]|nr:hypothetical protein [Blastocatellia bacterium]
MLRRSEVRRRLPGINDRVVNAFLSKLEAKSILITNVPEEYRYGFLALIRECKYTSFLLLMAYRGSTILLRTPRGNANCSIGYSLEDRHLRHLTNQLPRADREAGYPASSFRQNHCSSICCSRVERRRRATLSSTMDRGATLLAWDSRATQLPE